MFLISSKTMSHAIMITGSLSVCDCVETESDYSWSSSLLISGIIFVVCLRRNVLPPYFNFLEFVVAMLIFGVKSSAGFSTKVGEAFLSAFLGSNLIATFSTTSSYSI